MEQENKQLSAMLVPLSWSYLLIPCSAIAELIAFQKPVAINGTPDWFMGQVSWRDQTIPLVSFEKMSGKGMKEFAVETLYIVINRLTENGTHPFYAIPVQGIPRNLRLTADDINWKMNQNSKPKQSISDAIVSVAGQEALIPNLVGLESMLTEYMSCPA